MIQMALSKQTLIDGLRKIIDPSYAGFEGHPESAAEATQRWTAAYATYAVSAEDASTDLVITTNSAGFQAALNFAVPGTPLGAAQQFGAAFTAFWTGAVFAIGIPIIGPGKGQCLNVGGTGIFGIEITSIVTSVINTALITNLTSEFSISSEDGADKADKLATIFHDATTQDILVLITGTDTTLPTPLPITNTCQVF